jgi:hypothetical protein
MTRKKRVSIMLDPEMLIRLDEVRERLGLTMAEQVRRGIDLWLDATVWRRDRDRHESSAKRPADREWAGVGLEFLVRRRGGV